MIKNVLKSKKKVVLLNLEIMLLFIFLNKFKNTLPPIHKQSNKLYSIMLICRIEDQFNAMQNFLNDINRQMSKRDGEMQSHLNKRSAEKDDEEVTLNTNFADIHVFYPIIGGLQNDESQLITKYRFLLYFENVLEIISSSFL